MTIESPTDGDVFLAFLKQVLGPRLEPGHIVILDNLGAHKVEGVRGLVESRGAQLLYLPLLARFQSHRASLIQAETAGARRQGPLIECGQAEGWEEILDKLAAVDEELAQAK